MRGLEDLKKTRAYQEAQEQKQDEFLKITVLVLLEKGMTVEEIVDIYELPTEIIQAFVP